MDEESRGEIETPETDARSGANEPAAAEAGEANAGADPAATLANDAAAESATSADSAPADETPVERVAPAVAPAPMTAERVLDITLGLAVITGEAIDRAVQRMVEQSRIVGEQAPGFLALAEERGRPIRVNVFGIGTEDGSSASPPADRPRATGFDGDAAAPPANAAAVEPGGGDVPVFEPVSGADQGAPASAGGAGGDNIAIAPNRPPLGAFAGPLRSLGNSLGLLGGPGKASAEDEIRTLEDRVRQLERTMVFGEAPQTVSEPAAAGSPSAPAGEAVSDADVTPADGATYIRGVGRQDESLADSPYAISETDEEQRLESEPATPDVAPSAGPASPRRRRPRGSDAEPVDDSGAGGEAQGA
jgi:hypothetical protein